MKIVQLRTIDGPNYWSITRHQLVVMTLDLGALEDQPTHKIPGFYQRLRDLLPTMYQHRCSEGEPGGFFRRVEAGTWMGHVIEHIALELQTLAGMDTGFGRTRDAGRRGLYYVVFSYVDAEAGLHAARAAVAIAQALIDAAPLEIGREIAALRSIADKNRPGPSTAAIIEEAKRRDIPVIRLNSDSLFQLGYGAAQRRIEAAVTSNTSHIAVEIAADKAETKRLLRAAAVPVADGGKAESEEELLGIVRNIGYPVVIKPLDGNHGNGATLDIGDEQAAIKAFHLALQFSRTVICERFVDGFDYRVLVVNYKVIAAALRSPASITGDGLHTVQELVDIVNAHPDRGEGHCKALTRISIDEALLQKQGFSTNDIAPEGRRISLQSTANLSTGGTAADVTEHIHPRNKALFERAARIIGLDICGIDVMATGLDAPIEENGGVILEVNAGPGLRMHLHPTAGKARYVAAPIVEMLFPHGSDGRIPIIGVTGTNGKTTTTRLIAHMGRKAGYTVGCTTSDGVYIGEHLIQEGDCTGPASTRLVLHDAQVNLAVLECARGGLLRGGLGFDKCDIAVITNIAEDHLGINGINTMEKLTRLKGVLAESACPGGCAVLNADDDRVYGLTEKLRCNIALFSMHADSPRIRDHVRKGGLAATVENHYITIIADGVMHRIARVTDIPVTFGGLASFNIANALAASLAGYLQGIDAADISNALASFDPTPEQLPGRMNCFDFGAYKVIVDYAHNAHGLKAIGTLLRAMPAACRLGVIAGVGDRRDEDILALGSEAANIFDEIIIRQDKDLRGRTADELNDLVVTGIRKACPDKRVSIVPDEMASVHAALAQARPGMLVAIFADDVPGVIQAVRNALASGNFHLHEKAFA